MALPISSVSLSSSYQVPDSDQKSKKLSPIEHFAKEILSAGPIADISEGQKLKLKKIEVQESEVKSKSECFYIPANRDPIDETFLQKLIEDSNEPTATVENILADIQRNKASYAQFQFKFLIGDKASAETFAKALQVKAQEAHRFVPQIGKCEFIRASLLGFNRIVAIPKAQIELEEHLLVNKDTNVVIFIEEWYRPIGKVEKEKGGFAAINAVEEDHGKWYFTGTYLYPESKTELKDEKIAERLKMYSDTFENMKKFCLNKDEVEKVYHQLKRF
jgi:hypothetical protein